MFMFRKGELVQVCKCSEGNKDAETTQQKGGGMSGKRKRRGRPTKVLAKRSKSSADGMTHNRAKRGDGIDSSAIKGSPQKIPMKVWIPKDNFTSTSTVKKPLHIPAHKEVESYVKTSPQLEKVKLPNELGSSGKQLGRHSSGATVNYGSPTQGSQDGDGEKVVDVSEPDCMKKEVEMVNAGGLGEPLQCYEAMHSAMTVVDTRTSSNDTVQQSIEARDSQIDAEKNQSLPFVRNSLIWDALESIAVYQKMPQKPHFKLLIESEEVLREGLAIGLMVTFASLVERTNSLQFEDPVSSFKSSLEVLLYLEMHGFDVKAVEGRLNELLLIKEREGKLQDESKEVKGEIMEHSSAKANIEEEIDEIDKRMRELQEKRALIMSRKEGEDFKICILQSKAKENIEGLQKAHLDFERLAAAPL